jgi:uncharacterized protein (TIGR02466 family)
MAELNSARIEFIFPHPFLRHTWDDSAAINADLRRAILAEEAKHAGRGRSNIGGWHSDVGQLEWCGDAGKALMDRMVQMANHASGLVFMGYGRQPKPFGWVIQAWANANRRGDFNRPHTHPGSTWSGTYYVDTGMASGEEETTPLSLWDPCQGRANTFFPITVPEVVYVAPEPGLMVLFPSYIPHMVNPHRGSDTRTSIAFNLRKEPFP